MSEAYVGEIRAFAFGQAPRNWARCEGQLLAINQNQALFSILGTTYGGNGVNTFALPDLRGRVPVHTGSGVTLGQTAGETAHALTQNEIPSHVHTASASSAAATLSTMVAGSYWAAASYFNKDPSQTVAMSPNAVAATGGSQPHENMQPYTAVSYCIAINGLFPSRN